MAVLDCFSETDLLTGSQVAARTGLPLSTVHRIMQALVKGGYLRRSGRDGYRLGPRLASLIPRPWLADEIAPDLYALAARIRLTVNFGVIEGDQLATLVSARPPSAYCAAQLPQPREPLHATAMGKALLAFDPLGPSTAVGRLGPLSGYTPSTHRSPARLTAELHDIRRRGFARCDEERNLGIRGVAVPVMGTRPPPLGAIGVQARSPRMTEDLLGRLVPALHHVAAAIARRIQDHPVDL